MSPEGKNESYVIVDIDDLLTRAVLIEKTGETYGIRGTSEAPTTVDSPVLDVTEGVKKVVQGLGQSTGKRLWRDEGRSKDYSFLCSSSTGGSLYMMVAGVIGVISGESAQRAALGAGALLIDVFSRDDSRPEYEMVERMRSLKPDMFLLAGGTDGGAVSQVLDMASVLGTADVRPRFGSEYRLPVIFAGNVEAREGVSEALSDEKYATRAVDNVRPIIELENLGPAKEAIYDSFMEHVIVHSPGYGKLVGWVDEPIIPTQAAVGRILYSYASERKVNLLAVDLGGATTDVYSVFNGVFNRSLNADIGLTYGICNVMKEAGVQSIMRWIPVEMSEKEVRNIIGNLMILEPKSLSPEEALVQQGVAREAIRLGVEKHKEIATRLKGIRITRTLDSIFDQFLELTYLDMMKTRVIIGRGKAFAGSKSGEAALLLLDALQPEGVTQVMIDGVGIMPHLGMLAKTNPEAALQVFSKECLHSFGTCLAPRGKKSWGEPVMSLLMTRADGSTVEDEVAFGELKALALGKGEKARIDVTPRRGIDVGRGNGKRLETEVIGGEMGLIVDARGRPLAVPENREILARWMNSLAAVERPLLEVKGAD